MFTKRPTAPKFCHVSHVYGTDTCGNTKNKIYMSFFINSLSLFILHKNTQRNFDWTFSGFYDAKQKHAFECLWPKLWRLGISRKIQSHAFSERIKETMVDSLGAKLLKYFVVMYSQIGKSTEFQRGFVSICCGISIVVGSAVCLRLPGLLFTYGVGKFFNILSKKQVSLNIF